FKWSLVPFYIIAQLTGGAIGSFLVWLSYKDHFNETTDEGLILACHSTIPNIRRYTSNFTTETIGTLILVLGVIYLVSTRLVDGQLLKTITIEGKKVGFGLGALSALPVGLLVLGIGLSLGGPTGYAINPARDLSPRIMHAVLPIPNKGTNDWSYAWIPVAAPIVGGLLAAGLYVLLTG